MANKLKSKPKKDWIKELKYNTSVTDVVWGVAKINGKEFLGWVGLTPSTTPFSNFCNRVIKDVLRNEYTIAENFNYDEIVEYGHQNKDYKVKKIPLITSDILYAKEDWGKMMLVPYSDGVMLYGINVKESLRGKGIGTEMMNKLYDISEEMNIPIYLIPYPDDNFPTNDEKILVDRLKNYYERIGFGPISKDRLVWCNFE